MILAVTYLIYPDHLRDMTVDYVSDIDDYHEQITWKEAKTY